MKFGVLIEMVILLKFRYIIVYNYKIDTFYVFNIYIKCQMLKLLISQKSV